MSTHAVALEPDSAAQRKAQELLEQLADRLTDEPLLLDALRQLLEPLAAGHTVRIVEDRTYYTPTEAGRLLGLSRQYVDRLIARGELPVTHKPGSRHRLVDAADIAVLAARRDEQRRRVDTMVESLLDGGAEY